VSIRRLRGRHSVIAALATMVCFLPATAALSGTENPEFSWQLTPTGTDARLRGLDAVSRDVAWTSGSEGTVLLTLDGGQTWQDVSPPGTEELEFRDVEAFNADTASILSIGTGEDSRIYRTTDGGQTWALSFQNTDENAFYDCMDFFDRRRGLALSDPVDGKFRIIATDDGGLSWTVVPNVGMPPALPGEFAFAASGTCLVTGPGSNAWFATGGSTEARVFHSTDGGVTWSVATTPIHSDESSGIFSLAFADAEHGLAVGGDFAQPDVAEDAAALTSDGGATWDLIEDPPGGYRSGSAWVTPLPKIAIVVGPTGSDVSTDRGQTWTLFDEGSFDSVDCAPHRACWASGEQGRVARLVISDD
jgi:photosystem II stability/assembly factor-like uncharacterized protein